MIKNPGFSDEEIVEHKLRHFIKKYYRVKILQGLTITVGSALAIFFGLVILGNIFPQTRSIRNVVLILFMLVFAGVAGYYIFKPLLQLLGWIKGLNFKDASQIIRQKHTSIQDRIINVIELTREKSGKNNQLYDHAISQKTVSLAGFDFDAAISFKKLGVFLVRLLVLAVIVTAMFLIRPDFVRQGIGQILLSKQEAAMYGNTQFKILNDSLVVESGKDFLLRFSVSSDFPVEKVSIRYGFTDEPVRNNQDVYEYLFKGVNSAVTFRLAAGTTESGNYELKTLKKPEISGIQLKLIPPGYTELESTVIEGDGSAEVPAGSTIIWTVRTVNTDELSFTDESGSKILKGDGSNWKYEKNISKNTDYALICRNSNGLFTQYLYKLSIVKDLYPTIDISESRDSVVSDDVYIQGVIQDDYGFSRLEIIEDRSGTATVKEINIKSSGIFEQFYYTLKPDSTNTVYYFRIWDNDRITGPKFTDSRKISLRTVTRAEVENLNNQLADSIKSSMTDGMDAIDKMEKKISEFRMDQVLGELKPWEIQEKMKELNQLKETVVDFLNNISKTNKEFTENEDFLKVDEEMAKKAKEIQDLMEGLMDDEMRDLLKQFEQLAKEFNEQEAENATEKMQMNLEKLKEQMEMSLELFKKYDMEKDLIRQAEKLNQLADSLENIKSPQPDTGNFLKEEFKKWEEEYEKKLSENQELKKPMNLDEMKQERDEVRNSADDMGKTSSASQRSEKRSKAATGLKNMAKKMQKMLGMEGGEGEFVDLEDIRQIRNSLNDFSIKQEDLNNRLATINLANPTFSEVIKSQKELQAKFTGVSDSLRSIGYKQPIITKMIGEELFHVETSMKNLFESYTGSRADVVRIEQNKIMTDVNSMAVKLDELIRSMQNAKGKGKGDKGFTDRKKPKEGDESGSEKMGKTKAQQESMKEQLKSAIQKMKAGNQGKKERGEMARMLGEREMMRKVFEKMLQQGGLGNDARQKANEALEMMKDVEKDIIYDRLNEQTLNKDNMIHTKLLEAENAEKERENENRRESKEFKGSFEPNRKELGPTPEQNKALEQMLKYNELKLKKFYQEKYQKYIESTKK